MALDAAVEVVFFRKRTAGWHRLRPPGGSVFQLVRDHHRNRERTLAGSLRYPREQIRRDVALDLLDRVVLATESSITEAYLN